MSQLQQYKLDKSSKVPTNSPDAEIQVLGCALLYEADAKTIAAKMQVSDFYLEAHQVAFTGIKEMLEGGWDPNAFSLGEHLGPKLIEKAGGFLYLTRLSDKIITRAMLGYHIDLLKEKAAKRKADQTLYNISMDLHDRPLADILPEIKKAIEELEDSVVAEDGFCSAKQATEEMLEYVRDFLDGKVEFESTGFAELDEKSPIADEDLVIIGARPSVGKTAMGLDIAAHKCRKGDAVAFISTEMGRRKLMMRLVSIEAGRNFSAALRTKNEDITFDTRFMDAIGEVATWPLFIMDQGRCTAAQIYSWVKSKKKKLEDGDKRLAFVIVDYLQNLKGQGESSRQEEVGNAAKDLKQMSLDLKVPTILLAQIGREFEKRAFGKGFKALPISAELRDSGGAEQAADTIWLIHRPLSSDGIPQGEGVIVRSKVRDGEPGLTWTTFDGDTQKFTEVSGHPV